MRREAQETALEAQRYLKTIRELGEVLEVENPLAHDPERGAARGSTVRDRRRCPMETPQGGDVVHYKDWLALVVAEGHKVGGKNSAATFLTQVARETTVERVGRRTGLHRLIAEAG